MTAAVAAQQPQAKDATRKRRRRAPGGGAADDCFSCSKKNLKCDRKRPYCSQCLEVGTECSGYKTQLTWGVGVASRGKLRGLSLPIAKSPPVAGATKKSPSRSRSSSGAAASRWTGHGDSSRRSTRDELDVPSDHGSSPSTPYYGYDYLGMPGPESAPTVTQGSWPNLQVPSSPLPLNDGPNYRKLGTHLAPIPIVSEPAYSSSLDSVSDFDSYMSQFSRGDDVPYVHSPTLMYDSYQNSPMPRSPAAIHVDHRPPTSCPSLVYAPSEPSSSLTSHMDSFEVQLSQRLRECDSLSVPELDAYSASYGSTGPVWSPPHEVVAPHHSDQNPAPRWPSVSEPQPVHVNDDLIAKMPFFMDYYKNTMAPSMVFVDGPHNPYRDHILALAQGSQSLRHAICALSACNLRMKRRLSLGQDTRDLSEKIMAEKAAGDALADAAIDDHALSEEYQHRNLAVHLLNHQLNDTSTSTHDAVLATILILCHYRIAESGIAKFQTQFAGIKKLLALRRSQQHFAPLRDAAWMEASFTYFDAISASINNREAQLNGSFYGSAPDAQLLPPGVENLLGCDRELFKTISKLGRLNLLSQHRPVQSLCANAPSQARSPLTSPLGHVQKGSLSPLYGASPRFDGNGFGTTLSDEELFSSAARSSALYDDQRSNFWREWQEARSALQNWEFDTARLQASLPGNPTASQMRDLRSLSEAFRYTALLYTERLANPNVSSSNSDFQNLVSQVIYYVTSLEAGCSAEKFLLWPLFVAGSECVNELQQNIIRSRCQGIMGRSGYMNNLAALDVLEKLWSGDFSNGTTHAYTTRRGPFTWTRCMWGNSADVEWIMF